MEYSERCDTNHSVTDGRRALCAVQQQEVVTRHDAHRTLQQFCRWMTRRHSDVSSVRHDIAVLLTREKFGPAGYAPVTGLCNPSRSCTVITDEGFTSGFIIAHEMAHVMGVFHDGQGNPCTGPQYTSAIMAPLVEAKLNRFWWSHCSRERLQQVLPRLKFVSFSTTLAHCTLAHCTLALHPRSLPRSLHPCSLHPRSLPRSLHPRSLHPRSAPSLTAPSLCTLARSLPRSLHPRSLHPRSLHPRSAPSLTAPSLCTFAHCTLAHCLAHCTLALHPRSLHPRSLPRSLHPCSLHPRSLPDCERSSSCVHVMFVEQMKHALNSSQLPRGEKMVALLLRTLVHVLSRM
ncbi:hypothetical protein ACOMHN_064483 [Nucella lapillus]